jgi:hypothetical protein
MATLAQRKALAREATKLVKDKAPAIVDEQIILHALDEIAEFTGDLMGKLTYIDTKDEKAIAMAHGIIRDGLMNEFIAQLKKDMDIDFERRLTLFEKK